MSGDITGRAVVAAVDGSESARHAAFWAAAAADHRHRPLRLVNAVKLPLMPYSAGPFADQGLIDALVQHGRDIVGGMTAHVARRRPGLAVDGDVVVADPVTALVGESESAAVLVLGSRGLGGLLAGEVSGRRGGPDRHAGPSGERAAGTIGRRATARGR